MCAALELNSRGIRPGRPVAVWRRGKSDRFVWAGFARSESLAWWRRKGGELVDVPAHRFAERSERDGKLRWDDVPQGFVVRGLVDPNDGGTPLLKIVTRASTEPERQRFEHPRMPLLEAPLFSADAPAGGDAADAQPDLFS